MAISDNYIKNSTPRHFQTNDIYFDFKTFNTPFTDMTDMSDLSFGISTNEHAFYNDYTFGITDTKTKFDSSANVADNTYNDSADFASTNTAVTYCLVYFPNSHGMPYVQENIGNFEYINFTTGETNINDLCYLVTDFQFDNIILHPYTLHSDWYVLHYDESANGYQPLAKWGNKDDMTKLSNVMSIGLHYWNGSNSHSITDNFVLFAVVTLNGNTIAYKVTDNNIFSTLVTPEASDGEETTDFTGRPKFNENIKRRVINDKTFNHCINENNYLQEANFYSNKPTDRDKLGNVVFPKYTGKFQMYYCNIARRDYMLDILASIGLRFMYVDNTYGVSSQTYNDEISIAYMDENGVVDWTNVIKGLNNINKSDSYNKNIDYATLPEIDYKKEKADEKDHINPVDYRVINEIGGFTRYYKVSRADLASIITKINTATDLPDGYEFLPHIVSVRQYPFNTSQYATGHTESISIGGYDTGVTGLNLDNTQFAIQTIATIDIPHKYNNFLDKSPYTQLSLYIPFCSWVDLPDICVGETITVELAHDVVNGSCIGIVKLHGMPIVQTCGQMGTNISISAIENGLKNASMTQALFNVGGGVLSTGYAIATANPVGIASGIMSTVASIAQGNIANNSNYTHQIGSTQSKANDHISTKCYLRISYPKVDIPSDFAHTYGHICNETHTLSECEGFTVCENVDLTGFSCTDTEKQMIKSYLSNGCYL